MITTIAVALLNPMQVAETTVVPNVPEPAPISQSYDWTSQKRKGGICAGTAYTTSSLPGSNFEDWKAD